MRLKPPVGIADFAKVIDQDYLYIDKTLLIEEVLQTPAEVQLITRPRRFGKTINLSMLRYFFDNRLENSARLFAGLAIEKRPCYQHLGQFPVIALTFKDLKAGDFEEFLEFFGELMASTFRDHLYLADNLDELERDDFMNIARKDAKKSELAMSLDRLMKYLVRYHNQKVILLIDEYDSPIHEAYAKGYYEEVIAFMRPFLGKALKDNAALEKAVLTGILRVAKESVFSDLNNLKVFTILDETFADRFGFTTAEVTALLEQAGWASCRDEAEQWYNGYLIGETIIYNPWSILNFLHANSPKFQAHWVNTSSNDLVRDQILKAPPEVHAQLASLMRGETIETQIQQHTVFRDLDVDADALWSFLLFSGYLKVAEQIRQGNEFSCRLAIPNLEVQMLYKQIISGWMRRNYGKERLDSLLKSLVDGDFETFGACLAELVGSILSYYDTQKGHAERVYHAFVLGMAVHLSDRFELRSDRESGFGRYDLMMRPRHPEDRGIIMEFKAAQTADGIEAALDAAQTQIAERHYAMDLEQAGIGLRSEIAVAFFGKKVAIRGREIRAVSRDKH